MTPEAAEYLTKQIEAQLASARAALAGGQSEGEQREARDRISEAERSLERVKSGKHLERW